MRCLALFLLFAAAPPLVHAQAVPVAPAWRSGAAYDQRTEMRTLQSMRIQVMGESQDGEMTLGQTVRATLRPTRTAEGWTLVMTAEGVRSLAEAEGQPRVEVDTDRPETIPPGEPGEALRRLLGQTVTHRIRDDGTPIAPAESSADLSALGFSVAPLLIPFGTRRVGETWRQTARQTVSGVPLTYLVAFTLERVAPDSLHFSTATTVEGRGPAAVPGLPPSVPAQASFTGVGTGRLAVSRRDGGMRGLDRIALSGTITAPSPTGSGDGLTLDVTSAATSVTVSKPR